ncbi:MAG: hypothetical protein WC952_11420 [Desulfobulbaceae bacterium]
MRRRPAKVLFVAALLLGSALLAVPQARAFDDLISPRARQGYYLSAGPTFGMSLVRSEGRNTGPWPGPGMQFRVGETLAPWVALGVGFASSWGFQDNYRITSGSVSLEATFTPLPSFFAVVGAGAGWLDVTRRQSGMDEIIGRFSASYTLVVGWDILFKSRRPKAYQSGGVSLAPMLGTQLSPSNAATSSYLFWVGINATWWSGYARNRLDLPPEVAF